MSTYNPRIVGQALDDLQDQLTRWSSVTSEMLAEAGYTQRYAKEAVDRAIHHAAIIVHAARDDETKVQKEVSVVRDLTKECDTAKSFAHKTLAEVQNSLRQANVTLRGWETELEQAREWLAKAQARLEEALKEYERACDALDSAEWDLDAAKERYRDCRNDEEQDDCSDEAATVRVSEDEVEEAQKWVAKIEQEVAEAQEEVNQAQARVDCCRQAVNFAAQALGLAQEAEADAIEATNSADRSLEFAQTAERSVQIAEREVAAEVEVAERMTVETQIANSLTDDAASYLRRGDDAGASAKGLATTAVKELEHRIQLLYEFDRPTLSNG